MEASESIEGLKSLIFGGRVRQLASFGFEGDLV